MATWPANGSNVDVWDTALLTWLTSAVFDNDGSWKNNFAIDTSFTITDACDIGLGTTTGTKIGTAVTQKLGFYNATPIVQPANTSDIKDALIALGLLATGGATPLNLDGGAITCGGITLADATNIILDTTTGTKIGTATAQKLGFYNATPVVQPANTSDIKDALIALGLLATGGATPLNLDGGAITCGGITLADATNIALDTTTGTKIGTATTQKLAFFNSTPIVQPANTSDIKDALIALGLLATGGATPLNLDGGTLTAGQVTSASGIGGLTVNLTGEGLTSQSRVTMIKYTNSSGYDPLVAMYRGRGTASVPDYLDADDYIGHVEMGAWNGTGFDYCGGFEWHADGNHSAGSVPSYMSIVLNNGATYSNRLVLHYLYMNAPDVYPLADNTYYLGKNDDDTPFAWKGLILKDQAGTGKYYRVEVYNDALRIVDLTD